MGATLVSCLVGGGFLLGWLGAFFLSTYLANLHLRDLRHDIDFWRNEAHILRKEELATWKLAKALDENREWAVDKLTRWEALLPEPDRATCKEIRMGLDKTNPKLKGIVP